MALLDIYDRLKLQGATVTLNDASLGSTGFDAFLNAQLQISGVQVTLTAALQPPGTSLVFSGTSGFLYAGGNGMLDGNPYNVQVTITEPGSTPVLTVAVSLGNGWVLGSSFFTFTGSPFDGSVIAAPALALSWGAGNDGLNFSAQLSLVGPLGILPLLFATPPGSLGFGGQIQLTANGPVFAFSAHLPAVRGLLGTVQLDQPVYSLSMDWVATPYDDGPPFLPQVTSAFGGVVGNVLPNAVPFSAQLALGSNLLTLELGATGTPPALSGVDQLGNFFGGQSSGFPGPLTPSVFSLPAGVALKQLVVQLDLSGFPFKLLSLGGTVGTTQAWAPIPGVSQFSINPLDLTWTLVDPGGTNFLFATVAAGITIGSYSFDVEVSYPDFVVAGHLPGGVTLGLGEINTQLFTSFPNNQVPANPDLNGSSVTFGEFDVVLSYKAKTFELSCQAQADIQIGSLDLGLQSGSLDLLLDFSSGGAQSRFSVAGVFSINQWQFLISATIQQAGLRFSGALTQPQTISVSDLLGQLLQGQVSAPSQFNLAVTVQSFALELDTIQGLLDVNGRLSWSLTICGNTFEPQFAIHVTSTGKGAARQWSGQLAGQMTLAGGTFLLAYNFAPSLSKLTGAWTSGSYDWLTAVGDFGQSMPALPAPVPGAQNPNLSANAALMVSYDFATDVFTLQGQAQNQSAGMTGFLVIVPATVSGSGSRGFAAGIQFALRPGFFASLSSSLAMFDAFGLTGTFGLAVANFNNSQFRVPLQGQNAFPGVVKGIALYGSFNWQQADATTQQAIASLTSNNSSLNVMLAFYEPTGGGFVFKFAGKLSNIKLSLGSGVDVNSVGLALELSSAVPFQVEFDIDLTVHPGSGWVSLPGESDPLLYFMGQLKFQLTKAGGVGGSAAVFMLNTWHEPFNIQGLTVGNLGLLLGVAVTDGVPLPSFGLTGLLAYMTPDIQFDVVVAVYFNGADPSQSLFVGSIKELNAVMLLQMMLWATAGVRVPSLLQSALGNYGVFPIPFDLSKATTQLTQADFGALNAYQVPADFFALATEVGKPIQQPLQGSKYSTLTVILENTDPTVNTAWYIADFQTGLVFVLTVPAPGAATYTLALQPWLYVVPTTTSIGPWQYTQGYGFGGAFKLPGMTLDVLVQLAPSLGLSLTATAPKPLTFPFDPTGTFQLPALLTLSSASDPSLGPDLSLSTYQQGGVPPHFYLDAKLSLLSLASLQAQVKILSSGLAFDVTFNVLTAQATLSCQVGDGAFAAAGSFTVTLKLDTDAVEIGGVTVIPSIHLDTGFGVSLGIGFPSEASSAQSATFSGKIFFVWGDQTFSASFSFTLNDLANLANALIDWIKSNVGELLKNLLNDVVAWAKALANGLFELTTELAAAALKALGAAAEEVAALLADIGRSIEQVYNAIKTVFGLTDAQTVWAITNAFRFQMSYVGLGQHIGPSDGSGSQVPSLLAWMRGTAGPAFASGQWQALPAPGAGLLTVNSSSLLGNMFQIDTAFFDPGLYAMRLRGLGLDMTLPYQRLSASQGVFAGSVPSSTELLDIGFGPFGFRHPAVSIEIYTDGSFEFNYGYPDGGDWSRAGGLDTPLFSGQGGFKVSRLAPGTALPSGWQPVSIAAKVDAILRASWHMGIDIGILSGGTWMNYAGGFSALAGYGDGITTVSKGQFDPSQPTQFAGQLFLGLSGGIYGSVNFGIVQASVSASYSVAIGIPFGANQSVSLVARVTVNAGASITINLLLFSITIHFHFSITLNIGGTLDWPGALALAANSAPLLPLRFRQPLLALATAPAPSTPLPLWFVPELTLVNGALQIVFGLTIPYQAQTPGCVFNELVQALLQWAMNLDEQEPRLGAGQPIAQARLRRLAQRLRAKPRLSRAYGSESLDTVLDYPTLVAFLSAQFVVQVGLPAAAPASNQAVAFPMVPDLLAQAALASNASYTTVTDFSSFNLQPSAYEDAIAQAFGVFRVDANAPVPAPSTGSVSVATYLFVAYFEFLLLGGSEAALQATGAAGLQDITPAQWAAMTFDDLAGSATASFRGGLQLPASSQAGAPVQPMYQVSGQQTAVTAPLLPASGFYTQLAPGAAGGWLSVQATAVQLSAAYLTAHTGITVQAPLTPVALPPLLSSPSQFGFSAFAPLNPGGQMAAIAAELGAAAQTAPVPVALLTGTTAAPVPLALAFAWATGLTATLAQVTQANGSAAAGVYRLTGCDPEQAAAIAALAALEQQQSGSVTLSLLYPAAGGFAATGAGAALLCTNLSTRSQPPQLSVLTAVSPAIVGPLADASAALAVFAAYVSTNNDGYYLATSDAGLAAAFGSATTLGVQILASRTASGTAAATAVLASDTCLVLQGALPANGGLFAVASGLPTYAPANAPGMLQLAFTRADPALKDASGSSQQWLDLLFNLMTLQVDANANFAAHGFAPPVSPQTQTGSTNWVYTMSVPLTQLLAVASTNPYAAIGTAPTVEFQLRDGFGNAVANAAPAQQPAQRYTDPLISPAAWIGSTLQWAPAASPASLAVSLSVDTAILDNNKTGALSLYQQTGQQLAMTGDVQLALASSLDGAGPTVLPAASLAQVQGFVAAVVSYLQGTGPAPQALSLPYTLAQPVLANPPLAVTVNLLITRVANVDAAAAALLPSVASAAAPVAVDLSSGLSAFATAFEAALPALKLATGAAQATRATLYAVAKVLTQPAIGSPGTGPYATAPTYFAPAPLYTELRSGLAQVPQYGAFTQGTGWPTSASAYTGVDCDQLAATAFASIDGLLGGAFAAAAYAANPTAFASIVADRAAIAIAYTDGKLGWLFDQQALSNPDDPSLWGARVAFSTALQDALASAYAIDGVAALPVTMPRAAGAALALYGTVQVAGASAGHLAASPCPIKLDAGATQATLFYPYRPASAAAQAALSQPLELVLTNLALGDIDSPNPTWLALALPPTIAIAGGTDVVLPVVDRYFPPTPVLGSHTWQPTQPAGTTLDQLAQWNYSTGAVVQPVAQDSAHFNLQFNLTAVPTGTHLLTLPLTVADALVRFQGGFAQIEPVLAEVLGGAAPAANIVAALADLTDALATASDWAGSGVPARAMHFAATVNLALTTRLSASTTVAGAWLLVVQTDAAPLPGVLSATPCSADGTPQPGIQVLSQSPLTVQYTPTDPTAPVLLQLALAGMDVRLVQSAWSQVQVTRNADLFANLTPPVPYGLTTEKAYVFTTPQVGFPTLISPALSGPPQGMDISSLVAPPASPTLEAWLAALLASSLGTAPSPRAASQLRYALPAFVGTNADGNPASAFAPTPRLLTRTLQLDNTTAPPKEATTPAIMAHQLAVPFNAWMDALPVDRKRGQVSLDFTLFPSANNPGPALFVLPNLYLGLSQVDAGSEED